jgi:hypothetical protein
MFLGVLQGEQRTFIVLYYLVNETGPTLPATSSVGKMVLVGPASVPAGYCDDRGIAHPAGTEPCPTKTIAPIDVFVQTLGRALSRPILCHFNRQNTLLRHST